MSLPQSGHRMSSLSVRNPRPTRDIKHFLQLKQSLCHCLSSKEMYLLPPKPVENRISGHFCNNGKYGLLLAGIHFCIIRGTKHKFSNNDFFKRITNSIIYVGHLLKLVIYSNNQLHFKL